MGHCSFQVKNPISCLQLKIMKFDKQLKFDEFFIVIFSNIWVQKEFSGIQRQSISLKVNLIWLRKETILHHEKCIISVCFRGPVNWLPEKKNLWVPFLLVLKLLLNNFGLYTVHLRNNYYIQSVVHIMDNSFIVLFRKGFLVRNCRLDLNLGKV